MNKSRINKIGIIISYILKIIIIALLVISIYNMHIEWILGTSLGLIVSLIPTILKRNYQITLPLFLELLIILSLILHIGGGLLNAYHTIPHYDTLTHFVSSFFIAFLAFIIIYILDVHWDGLIMDKHAMAFFVVMVTMAIGVVWEFNEWITDIIFGTKEQWGYNDTIKDLFIDMLAGIVVAIISVGLIRRGSMDEMTEELGEQIDKRIIDKFEKKGSVEK
jgi:uncharacterized membrane protein YjdF